MAKKYIDKLQVLICVCERCEYEWQPRLTDPIFCPQCKSPSWNKKRRTKLKKKIFGR